MSEIETIHSLRRAGRFAEAAARCREWIAREPRNAKAAQLLGLLLSQSVTKWDFAVVKTEPEWDVAIDNSIGWTNKS